MKNEVTIVIKGNQGSGKTRLLKKIAAMLKPEYDTYSEDVSKEQIRLSNSAYVVNIKTQQ